MVIKNNMKYNQIQCHTQYFLGIKNRKKRVNKNRQINDKIYSYKK